VISFFDHPHEGTMAEVAARIGGKGASLWAMTHNLALPVPPGFTIGTEHAATGLTDALFAEVLAALDTIGAQLRRRFGDPANPLLVSVRSGAPVSMPGMMDTILNVGATAADGDALGSADFVAATRAALRDQFARLLPGCDPAILDDPHATLRAAIVAVFASWNSARARSYRARQGIADDLGTAVTIQAMVFGHRDEGSGTGVAFSRCPSTGTPGPIGDWLPQAQGEAVVAGTHATQPLERLANFAPAAHAALLEALTKLEAHYRDMVDVEFTIESGKLWILQARVGKRTPAAATRIACDLVDDPIVALSRAEAVARVSALSGDGPAAQVAANIAIARGLGVSPGLVSGQVAVDCDTAIDMADAGNAVILVRPETSPEDVHGMGISVGILTASGGMMSHAALVAREWGIAAVCGAPIAIDATGFDAGGVRIAAGDTIAIDGTTGEVFMGAVAGRAIPDGYRDMLIAWTNDAKIRETIDG
jgi:pyruvate, orthophosphate dikinase